MSIIHANVVLLKIKIWHFGSNLSNDVTHGKMLPKFACFRNVARYGGDLKNASDLVLQRQSIQTIESGETLHKNACFGSNSMIFVSEKCP